MIFCHDKREYMTLGEYMEKYPIAYAEAVESMTAEQKALFAARFEDRYIYLPKDETSDTGEIFSISANVTNVTPDADNPESISAGGTAYWKYTVDGDAEAPIVAVTGCEWVAPAEGMIFLFNPTGNITITVSASLKSYAVTTQGVNCTFTPSTGTIQARGTLKVFINAAQNYRWNGTATVTGATAEKNISGGYIILSNPTGPVNVLATCDRIIYPVTLSGTHCTHTPNPTQIAAGATLAITYTAAAGYDLPDAFGVTVSGCSFGWKNSTGILTLYNPTGAVSASVVAVAKSYAITATVTNGTATGANVIHTGETVALTIAANEGYNLPDTVTVTGASQSWNKETGTLTLTNPTGAVTVSAVCESAGYTLEAGVYKWADMLSKLPVDEIDFDIIFVSGSTTYSNINISLDTNMEYTDTVSYFSESEGDPLVVYIASDDEKWSAVNAVYQTITLSTSQTVSTEFYTWAITGGNLVKQTGETWVLNEDIEIPIESASYNINFVSNETSFTLFYLRRDNPFDEAWLLYNDLHVFYIDGHSWTNQAYRTITFSTPPTGDLLTWLQANGTKQTGGHLHSGGTAN